MLGVRAADWEHHLTVQEVMCSYLFASSFSNVTSLRENVGSTCPCYNSYITEPLHSVTVYVG